MKSRQLYNRAKQLIPGGNQLLSKRPEMFLPGSWPSYYKKARGIEVWDLDDRCYLDMSIMGIGTCSLGYANTAVNKAVIDSIHNGSMATLNSYEEVQLAEKLIDLHPGMEMARFARTGGEANSIAVRIARTASEKNKIAVCGYHGWQDWYLAANLADSNNLRGLLLPGLEPNGVPRELDGTTIPFHYGDIDSLERIANDHGSELGAIMVEVQRDRTPDLQFLTRVQQLAKEKNAVLIFDEISSGFRLSIGGIYKLYDLDPDIVVLGKALGNGFAISAVLGKQSVMESAQNSFISSTYWTERTGYAAALATIEQFESKDIINYLVQLGEEFDRTISVVINEIGLRIRIDGLLTVPTLQILENQPLVIKTIITQEFLKRGYLASNLLYLTSAHSKGIIQAYASEFRSLGTLIKSAIENDTLYEMLDDTVCHESFQRLT